MDPAIAIRAERPEDGPTIGDIVRRAYAAVPHSDRREHLMIERLRESDAFIPALSLLAAVNGAGVGHVLLTRAHIQSERSSMPVLALAPLSVVPEWQSRGIGTRLVDAAHRQAAERGFGAIVLVGNADYYPRFGYRPLARYPIILPFDAPAPNCMIMPLTPGALAGVSGTVRYADAWLDH
ncbi:GNAT family N-acetyltransferase [Sphingomonas nostoxanthinifaciens]|uniref:GNAT family N-acetyltransferase n=1 Tax=Sphingomonas nostoxanthinifaciens TaxID=2872652 RepID=UPI001CC1E4BE|nr:N-acetyltransferase [Sphingomonas nostoxanthinifaciens]UAK24847.1 N-acetyltransferase [Sphingomonas nostoxanthinifaciens]